MYFKYVKILEGTYIASAGSLTPVPGGYIRILVELHILLSGVGYTEDR